MTVQLGGHVTDRLPGSPVLGARSAPHGSFASPASAILLNRTRYRVRGHMMRIGAPAMD